MTNTANHPNGESGHDLLSTAAGHGYSVSPTQLARWHRAGLLPRPRQRSKGRGNGTESLYPAGTGRQLLTLCRARQQVRSIDDLGWALWWEGYEVDLALVHTALKGALDHHTKAITFMRKAKNHNKLVDQAADLRLRTKFERQLRKRVGKDRFPSFMRVVSEVAAGRFKGFAEDVVTGSTAEEVEIIDRGLYLDRARKDQIRDAGPIFSGDTEQLLREIQPFFDPETLRAAYDAASVEELTQAREDVRMFLALVATFGTVAVAVFGRGAFGIGGLLRWQEAMGTREQATTLLFWLGLRQLPTFQQGAAAVFPAIKQWLAEGWPAFQEVEVLRNEVPAFREILSPGAIRSALGTRERQEKRCEELRAIGEAHHEEVQAALERHPEIKRKTD